MNPINQSGPGSIWPGDISSLVQSDENLIGSATPAELAAFLVGVVVAYLIGLFAAYYLKRQFSHRVKKDHLDFWIRLVRVLLILSAISITVPPFFDAGLIIILWILIGFIAVFAVAGQKVMANIVAALTIMYERPFSSGDFVMIGDTAGTVVSIGLFAITVRTVQGILVHVPNDQVYTTQTSNYNGSVARRFDYDIGIRYRDDSSRAIEIITKIIAQYTYALVNPAPEIFVRDLAESSVSIRIRVWFPSAWANTQDDISLKTAILPQVKAALESGGIEVPFPQRTLWFANEPGRSKTGAGSDKPVG